MKKVLSWVPVALLLTGASGLAVAGDGCGHWGSKDAKLDTAAQVAKTEAPKISTPVAKPQARIDVKAPVRDDTAKLAQASRP